MNTKQILKKLRGRHYNGDDGENPYYVPSLKGNK